MKWSFVYPKRMGNISIYRSEAEQFYWIFWIDHPIPFRVCVCACMRLSIYLSLFVFVIVDCAHTRQSRWSCNRFELNDILHLMVYFPNNFQGKTPNQLFCMGHFITIVIYQRSIKVIWHSQCDGSDNLFYFSILSINFHGYTHMLLLLLLLLPLPCGLSTGSENNMKWADWMQESVK